MELDAASANQAEVAITQATRSPHALGINDSPPRIADEPLPTGPQAPIMVADEDPVTRIQQELALWTSPRMKDVRDLIAEAARLDVTLLITGETGTGKELVARAVHYLGGRRHARFVKVNCVAVPRDLLESELFGDERGAFTGAQQLKVGKLEAANLGTIFLDEIGDLHPALQAKLLHLLEEGQFSRVGGRSTIKVNARIVAATNEDLEASVAAGLFREDLFYRLNVIRIDVPPLQKRPEDIPILANYFVQRYSRLFQREGFTLSPETINRLKQYSFPGNIRELENIIKRMLVLRDPDLTRVAFAGVTVTARAQDPSKSVRTAPGSLRTISRKAAQAAEQSAILKALEQTHWNRLRAAKLLNISYRSLLYKIKEAGLDERRKADNLP